MKIETLDDWNSVLAGCGCCEMPACPVPTMECESIINVACYFEHEGVKYRSRVTVTDGWLTTTETYDLTRDENDNCVLESTCSGSVTITTTDTIDNSAFTDPDEYLQRVVRALSANNTLIQTITANPDCSQCSVWSGSASYSGLVTYEDTDEDGIEEEIFLSGSSTVTDNGDCATYSDPDNAYGILLGQLQFYSQEYQDAQNYQTTVTRVPALAAESITYDDPLTNADILAGLADMTEFDPLGGGCHAFLVDLQSAGKFRFRWVIPDTWEGSYFKITWDVAFFPEGHDPEDPESPQPESVSTDNTWEWTGPGDPEDADTWKSGWYDIDPPSVPGTRRVVNIRYECYKSTRFGVKPQVTGEAVEFPPP